MCFAFRKRTWIRCQYAFRFANERGFDCESLLDPASTVNASVDSTDNEDVDTNAYRDERHSDGRKNFFKSCSGDVQILMYELISGSRISFVSLSFRSSSSEISLNAQMHRSSRVINKEWITATDPRIQSQVTQLQEDGGC